MDQLRERSGRAEDPPCSESRVKCVRNRQMHWQSTSFMTRIALFLPMGLHNERQAYSGAWGELQNIPDCVSVAQTPKK